MIQALWLYMPPYVNSTADITITGVSSTASSRRRKLQATSGSADVTTELGVANAHTVADTASHLSSVVGNIKFLVRHLFCCCYCESLVVTKAAAHPTCGSDKPWGAPCCTKGQPLGMHLVCCRASYVGIMQDTLLQRPTSSHDVGTQPTVHLTGVGHET